MSGSFVALARHRSLSATARALGVNHATVARRVAGLEAALGAALFERRPSGYALPRLATFQALHPGLDIELVADRRSVSLPRREADIALRLNRPKDGELVARRLAALRFGFYAATVWRDRLGDGAAPVFVGFDEANAAVPEAAWLASRFPAARVSLRANTEVAQAAAARAGCGIALLPRFLGAGDPGLVEVALDAAPPDRSVWLLSRSGNGEVPRVRIAKAFLVELFERERSLFEGL